MSYRNYLLNLGVFRGAVLPFKRENKTSESRYYKKSMCTAQEKHLFIIRKASGYNEKSFCS